MKTKKREDIKNIIKNLLNIVSTIFNSIDLINEVNRYNVSDSSSDFLNIQNRLYIYSDTIMGLSKQIVNQGFIIQKWEDIKNQVSTYATFEPFYKDNFSNVHSEYKTINQLLIYLDFLKTVTIHYIEDLIPHYIYKFNPPITANIPLKDYIIIKLKKNDPQKHKWQDAETLFKIEGQSRKQIKNFLLRLNLNENLDVLSFKIWENLNEENVIIKTLPNEILDFDEFFIINEQENKALLKKYAQHVLGNILDDR